jgi:hypothetical protein
MTIQRTVTMAVGSTSFRSEINNLFAGHPQAIVGQFDIPSAGVLFGELKQENLLSTPWVVSNLWFAKEFFTSVGASVATGPIYIANPGTENGGYSGFLALLKQKTGQTQPSNGQRPAGDSSAPPAAATTPARSRAGWAPRGRSPTRACPSSPSRPAR